MRTFTILFAALALAACGGSDSKTADAKLGTVDAPAGTPDAPGGGTPDAPAGAGNGLTTTCTGAAGECPTGTTCTGVMGVGSQTVGWCTPDCAAVATACTDGYDGPAGGMPTCALSTAQGQPPSQCVVICTDAAQCATGFTCQMVNAQTKICAPPA